SWASRPSTLPLSPAESVRAFLSWLVIVAVLAGLYQLIPREAHEDGRRPLPPEVTRPAPTPPPPPTPTQPLPPATDPRVPPAARRDPGAPLPGYDFILTVTKDGPRATDGLGTAFALDASGIWLTAGHVVDECKAVWVLRDRDWRSATAVRIH